jgi:hypothetical protein
VLRVTGDSLAELIGSGFLPAERAAAPEDESGRGAGAEETAGALPALLFPRIAVKSAPRLPRARRGGQVAEAARAVTPYAAFVMTLQQTDVGVGQTTAGTSRRSPEIFVPLAARDFAPEFWGWPNEFQDDPEKPGKKDRRGVPMWIGAETVFVNMMTWPDKHDFRLRSEALRSSGRVGDILRIERATENAGFAYYVQVVPVGAPQHAYYLSLCVNAVRNSARRWGYY